MRESRMDNIRFVLIFLVALGHFFEVSSSAVLKDATEFIYSFHMPVFVFVSGYFAKFNKQRIVKTYLYSYVLLQIAYFFFLRFYVGNTGITFQFSVPNYTLWYLLAMAFYCILIPLIQTESLVKKIIVLCLGIGLSLWAGTDQGIGYPFATGRFFGFLPFFILGFYSRCESIQEKLNKIKIPAKVLCGTVLAVVVAAAELFIIKSPLIAFRDMTYSYTYSNTTGGWKARAALLAVGFLWVAFLLMVTPNKKLPIISSIGANTFPIYIFHGFVIKFLIENNITSLSAKVYGIVAVALSLVMLLVFGNKIASTVAKWGFTGHWIGVLHKKIK